MAGPSLDARLPRRDLKKSSVETRSVSIFTQSTHRSSCPTISPIRPQAPLDEGVCGRLSGAKVPDSCQPSQSAFALSRQTRAQSHKPSAARGYVRTTIGRCRSREKSTVHRGWRRNQPRQPKVPRTHAVDVPKPGKLQPSAPVPAARIRMGLPRCCCLPPALTRFRGPGARDRSINLPDGCGPGRLGRGIKPCW